LVVGFEPEDAASRGSEDNLVADVSKGGVDQLVVIFEFEQTNAAITEVG
jgi:hypothetical protein